MAFASKAQEFPLDPYQALPDASAIKISVVPVGTISNSQFREYESLIKAFTKITVYEHGEIYNRKDTYFPQQEREGEIKLNFSGESSVWEDIQAHRKTLGVIGIVHCPNWEDLSNVSKEFAKTLSQTPHTAGICLAFSPMEHQRDLDHGIVVMIPNDGKLALYLSTLLIDFTKNLLDELETLYKTIDKATLLYTPFDPRSSIEDVTRFKKKVAARISKTKGDYCLLAGSPRDAIQHYQLAIDSARSQNDIEWQAAACEGYASALMICADEHNIFPLDTPGEPPLVRTHRAILEKCDEAFLLYGKRKCLELQLELLMKIVRFFISISSFPEANEKLMEAYHMGQNLPYLSKIQLFNSIGSAFRSMNFRRKFLFFLRESALLYKDNFNLPTAHCLLGIAAQELLMPELNPQLTYNAENNKKLRDYQVRSPHSPKLNGWSFLQDQILKELIDVTSSIGDNQTAARYSVYKLKHLRYFLPPEVQAELAEELMDFGKKQPGSLALDMVGIPYVFSMTPNNFPPHLVPHKVAVAENKEKGDKKAFKFIVGIAKKTQKQVNSNPWENLLWVQGQTVHVTVILNNPLSFPITIESISLVTDGCSFEAHSYTIIIPPLTNSISIVLSGKPLKEGTLKIHGCLIRAFNILSRHPVNMEGKGISMNMFAKQQENAVISIPVAPALPLLRIDQSFLKNSTLCVFEGEICNSQVEIENIGDIPIHSLEISIADKENQVQVEELVVQEPKKIFEWDQTVIQNHLPLLPNQSITLPVWIRGYQPKIKDDIEADFIFEYKSMNTEEYKRKHPLKCRVKVLEGLRVVNFAVLPSEQNTSSVSSVLLGSPSFDRHKMKTNSEKKLIQKLGDLQKTQTLCLLMFEVVNPTSHMFWIKHEVNSESGVEDKHESVVTMAPHSGRRLMIPFRRFDVPKERIADVTLQSELRQFVRSANNLSEEEKDLVRYYYLIKQELIKQVHISWRSDYQTSGVLSLDKLQFSKDNIVRLTPDIISFELRSSLPSTLLPSTPPLSPLPQSAEGIPCLTVEPSIGHFSSISVLMKNCYERELHLVSKILIYEDLGNGMHNMDASNKVLWHGTLDFAVHFDGKGQTDFQHNLSVCFCTPGNFRLTVLCKNKETKESYKCGMHILFQIHEKQ